MIEGEEAAPDAEPDAELSPDEVFEQFKDAFDGTEFEVRAAADGGDAGAAGMDAGLDASPGIDTGEAACMARPRGGPGGLDLNAMMKQVQQMQAEMAKRRRSSRTKRSRPAPAAAWSRSRSAATCACSDIDRSIPRRSIPRIPELLQDMVMAAVNEGIRAAQELASDRSWAASWAASVDWGGLGGLGLPGM